MGRIFQVAGAKNPHRISEFLCFCMTRKPETAFCAAGFFAMPKEGGLPVRQAAFSLFLTLSFLRFTAEGLFYGGVCDSKPGESRGRGSKGLPVQRTDGSRSTVSTDSRRRADHLAENSPRMPKDSQYKVVFREGKRHEAEIEGEIVWLSGRSRRTKRAERNAASQPVFGAAFPLQAAICLYCLLPLPSESAKKQTHGRLRRIF